ncbi:DUF4395 family protein [Marinifilum sp.]|uniref:DUF4395 family protein n=1 Tax=Marinifilum sp. TaxID=2033137 RepID=UPI003BACB926
MKKEAKRINDQLQCPMSEQESMNLKKAMRVTPISCIVLTSVGLFLHSPYIMWLAAATTLVGAFSRNSMYDRVYNLFAKVKVPPLASARSFGCAFGAIVLSLSGYMFLIGENLYALFLGGFMMLMAGIAAITQICFVSVLLNLFRSEKKTCCE